MRRRFVNATGALMLALLPAAVFAQTPPAQGAPPSQGTPPAQGTPQGTPPQGAPAQEQAPAPAGPPKVAFKGSAGILLVQVKPDQTAVFEEMIAKLKSSLAGSSDATLQKQASLKVYRSAEAGAGGNVLYVLLADPALPNTEYSFLEVINKTLTPEQQRDPATRDMYVKWAGAIAGMNILNLTPVAAGGM
jgi:hypothetical protein